VGLTTVAQAAAGSCHSFVEGVELNLQKRHGLERAANGCSGAECRETMQRRCILGWDSDIDRRRIKTLH